MNRYRSALLAAAAASLLPPAIMVPVSAKPAATSHPRPAASTPVRRIRAAAAASLREPSTRDYRGAIQLYGFVEGAVYRLIAAPERVSDIALQPGEVLVAVAAGDTARWNVGDTTSGSGETRRTHIMIKPLAPGLATNLIVTTDRRVYHLALTSTPSTAMAAVSWTYPGDTMIAIHGAGPGRAAERGPAMSVDPVELEFGYEIRGDKPPWRPLRAFDDGQQTFIEFPASLAQGTAPPLFVTGDEGTTELVNYRVAGRFYVVDRLFARGELRMGTKRQTVVRIVRKFAQSRGEGQ